MKTTAPQSLVGNIKVVLKLVLNLCLPGLLSLAVAASPVLVQKHVADAAQQLIPNVEIEREIQGSATHSFTVKASAGNCVRLIVQQKGIDVKISAKNSAGKLLAEVDRPNGSFGRETVTFTAAEDDVFLIEVSGYNSDMLASKYSILLKDVSPCAEADRLRIEAERLTSEGEDLRFKLKFEQSLTKFQAALSIWKQLNDDYEQAVVSYGIGWADIPPGKYDSATSSFSRSLKTAQTLDDDFLQTLDFIGIGWSELYSGNFETADFNFTLALENSRKNNYKSQIGKALFGLGNTAYLQKRYSEAFDLLTESVSVRRAINERKPVNLTNITLAKVLVQQKQSAKAIEILSPLPAIFKDGGDNNSEAEAFVTLGWAYFSEENYRAAAENFARALELRNELRDKAGQVAALRGLSLVHTRTGDFQNAETEVEQMVDILDSLRSESLSTDARLTFTASVQEYYEDGIEILMQMHERLPQHGFDRQAFDLNEQSRSRTLLDLVQRKQNKFGKKITPSLLAQKLNLQQKLTENLISERKTDAANGSENAEKQRLEIQESLFLLRETEEEINAQSTGSRETAVAKTIPLAEIQKRLAADTALLEYSLGSKNSFLWLVTREKAFSFALPKREIIENLVRETRDALFLQRSDPLKGEKLFNQKAAELSRLILAPALSRLKNQRLLIVPQGALQYLPFAALPENNQPLLVNHEISYLPSASLLAFLQKQETSPYDKQIAVFADPVFSATDERLRKFSIKNEPEDLEQNPQRLFISRFEAEKIASFVPPEDSLVALDWQASREKVIETDLSRYRILHFATHVFINDEQPELSAVMLSNFNVKGQQINGLLRSSEIINLDLDNEMVVLSGCRTGLGKNVRGEGLLSLSRSFLLAGTRRLVVSLWEVQDKPTAELMARFYHHLLKEKMPTSVALHTAQLEIMRDARWQSPFYWAAFVIQSN